MPVPDRVPPDTKSSLQMTDGVQLFTQAWTHPDPKAIMLLVHGYGEHSGRYGHVARALNDMGVSVCTYDQRGYGRSEGRTAYVDTFDQYLDDLRVVLDHVRRSAPDVPMYLFGHSMGGAVVLLYALERQTVGIRGLILSSPAIEVDPDIAPLLRKVAKGIGRLFPRLPVVPSPEGRHFTRPRRGGRCPKPIRSTTTVASLPALAPNSSAPVSGFSNAWTR